MTTKGFEQADVKRFWTMIRDWGDGDFVYEIQVHTMGDTIPRCILTVSTDPSLELFSTIFDHADLDLLISLLTDAKSALDAK